MTITNITRDRHFVQPGETVQFTATFTEGTRCRFRLLSKPTESKLEVFDDARGNYLTRAQLVPDCAGTFILEAVEEIVAFEAPRFSNDTGPAHSHGGTVRGVESVNEVSTLIPHTVGAYSGTLETGRRRFALPVVEKLSRQIGIDDEAVTFTCHTCGSFETTTAYIETHWVYDPTPGVEKIVPNQWIAQLEPTINGVISRAADRTLAPSLSVSSRAVVNTAANAATTLAALREIGGADYGDMINISPDPNVPIWFRRPGEDATIIPWDDVIDADPFAAFRRLQDAANAHITRMDTSVHGAADNVNVLAAPTGSTIAEQTTLLNNLRTVLLAHASNAAHTNPDAIAVAALTALAPLAAPTQDECSEQTNVLWTILDEHLTRLFTAPGNGVQMHLKPADNRLPTTAKAIDQTTATTRQAVMSIQYNLHRVREQTHPTYHNTVATSAELSTHACDGRDSFVTAVGELTECVMRHCENMSAAGVSTAYHTSPDHSSILALLRTKPTSFADATITLEAVAWTLATHAAKGSPQHDFVWPGAAAPTVSRLPAVSHAFTTALQSTAMPADPGSEGPAVYFEMTGWRTA